MMKTLKEWVNAFIVVLCIVAIVCLLLYTAPSPVYETRVPQKMEIPARALYGAINDCTVIGQGLDRVWVEKHRDGSIEVTARCGQGRIMHFQYEHNHMVQL